MSQVLPTSPSGASAWPLYRAMVGVGLACGLLIAGVYALTRPIIARNRAEALERAILDVLPGASSSESFRLLEDGGTAPAGTAAAGDVLHAGYDSEGRLVGVAVEARGMGYQDEIVLLYGYALERGEIVGLRVLESRETPGLGDKIGSDPRFLASFEALDVSLAPDGTALAHPITAVKRGRKQHAWEIDGITGATISSQAIAAILRKSAGIWIPRIHARAAELRQGLAQ